MKTRRDFLKLATASGVMAMAPGLLYGDNYSILNASQKKAIAQLWQIEKMRDDIAKKLGEDLNVETLKTIGTWSASNRKSVLNELVKLYNIDLSYTEDATLLYTTTQIAQMTSGTFASTALQNKYDTLLAGGMASKKDALLTMVKLTVDEISATQRYLDLFSPSDKIAQNLTYVIDGAMGHYWALDRELIKIGVLKGCCEAGKQYCKTPMEYAVAYGRDHLSDPEPLSNEQRHAIAHMWSEEKMAHDAFEIVYSVYPHLRLFYNIGHWSETQHLSAVEELVALYNIDVNDYSNTEKHYDPAALRNMAAGDYAISDFETRFNNVLIPYALKGDIQALQLGCMVEVQDIWDLTGFVEQNTNPYIKRTFDYLIAGSQSHYWAYHYALIEKGISGGCCSAGGDYCKDASEYPAGSGQRELASLWNRKDIPTCMKSKFAFA
jgi:hypothetical protein